VPAPNQLEFWVVDLTDFPLGDVAGQPVGQVGGKSARFRQQFILRLLLGSYLGCPGKDVRFDYGPSGKPRLSSSLAQTTNLTFNASHSRDWLAVAIGRDIELGVDIEVRREMPRASALATRFLSAPEAGRVSGLDEPARSDSFLKVWTRREALVKAMGSSIFTCLKQIQLDPDNGEIAELPSGWPCAQSWSLTVPEMPEVLIGALATPSSGVQAESFLLNCKVLSSDPRV
jgi:4'-phosphopantetheinyl transferase